jgi:hypothetical protein
LRNHIVTIRDTAGNVEADVSVYVYAAGTTTEATLYSDNGVTEITNPVTTNSKGQANFWVADGVYDLYVTGDNITAYTLEDVYIYEPIGATATQTLTNKTLASPSITFASTSKTAAYTATSSDFILHCDASSGAFTLTLPAAASHTGRVFVIGKSDSSAYAVLVDGNGSETIDGVTGIYLYLQHDYMTIVSDGSNWKLIHKTWQDAIIHLHRGSDALSPSTTDITGGWVFTYLKGKIIEAYVYLKNAPSSAASVFDVNVNGTTIWSTQANRVQVAVGDERGVQNTFDTSILSQDDLITVDYDSGDTWESAQDLTVLITARVQPRLLS